MARCHHHRRPSPECVSSPNSVPSECCLPTTPPRPWPPPSCCCPGDTLSLTRGTAPGLSSAVCGPPSSRLNDTLAPSCLQEGASDATGVSVSRRTRHEGNPGTGILVEKPMFSREVLRLESLGTTTAKTNNHLHAPARPAARSHGGMGLQRRTPRSSRETMIRPSNRPRRT